MPSSRRRLAVAVVALVVAAAPAARAQTATQGFAVERLYPSAPTGGWFVMDTLELDGGLGAAAALTLGYAARPLHVADATQTLDVVSDEAMADVSFAVTFRRWRFYVGFPVPLVISGDSGTVGGYAFTAPSVTFDVRPDTIFDARIGTDVRIWSARNDRFRLGAGAQLFIPGGSREDYDTDDTFRAMLRVLVAGDVAWLTYAAQLGVHIRPLSQPSPGGPAGSELLFGAAAGAKLPLPHRDWRVVVGPELFGASAFTGFFGARTTAFEGLLSARIEGTRRACAQLRIKLGVGAGLDAQFGAPAWRLVVGVELFRR